MPFTEISENLQQNLTIPPAVLGKTNVEENGSARDLRRHLRQTPGYPIETDWFSTPAQVASNGLRGRRFT